jgi:hypothetical protein
LEQHDYAIILAMRYHRIQKEFLSGLIDKDAKKAEEILIASCILEFLTNSVKPLENS